jgi:transposase-like protein
MSVLSKPYFHDEQAAFEFVESIIWDAGPVCPHCGGVERITSVKPNPEKRVRFGLKRCGQCKGQFTVRMGTIFEESKLPMTKWLQAIYLMCSSKKGISAKQLERTLEVTYKTAWFLAHRVREAMRPIAHAMMGSDGGAVEVDETFIGQVPGDAPKSKMAIRNMNKVMTLVERNTGRARSIVVTDFKLSTIEPILFGNIAPQAHLMTDEAKHYIRPGKIFADHGSVNHAKDEYTRNEEGKALISTNTVEGFYSVFKRGMKGVYQHCQSKHLPRYLAEFDFRYSNRAAVGIEDTQRATIALKGAIGRRLTYRRPDLGTEAAQA